MIVPAAVDVLNEFAPMAATRWAGVICLASGLTVVGSAKWQLYVKTRREEAEAAKKREER